MPINHYGIKFPTCYAICSIGHKDSHTLRLKLKAIADAGFDAVELSMLDILAYGKMLNGQEPNPKDYDALVEIGKQVRVQAAEHNLKILMLQPFSTFEGWPGGSCERKDAFEPVGTDMLQVGSSDAPGISSSLDSLASDLAELADLYVWRIVEKANRPNLGLCLDTFQSSGGEWADPTTQSGLIKDLSRDELGIRWQASLAELTKTWSHDYRPLPFDGGYLPVQDLLKAVLGTGFKGWLSIEVFDGKAPGKYSDMVEFSRKAMLSLAKLLQS
ncbi:xylose isomerase-like protein [Annulohypoxylon bovei var. microspora]|nr:xylose isomerase-like protein [Annulohypoxylon bovei var. microspora]